MLPYIFLLTLVGGAIAYIGDRVGRRVGKKRMSLFGLRPRKTSVVITLATGFMIAGGSALFLSILSKDFRAALLQWDQVKSALFEAERSLALKDRELGGANKRLAGLRKQMAGQAGELELLQEDVSRFEDQSRSLQFALEERQKEKDALSREIVGLEKSVVRLSEQKAGLVRQNDGLLKRKKELEKETDRLKRELDENQRIAIHRSIAFNAGERLLRLYVRNHFDVADLRTALKNAAAKLNELAVEKGAEPGFDVEGVFFSRQVELLMEKMTESWEDDWLVDFASAGNVFVGEALVLSLDAHVNAVAFRRGELLLELEIAPGLSGEKVDQTLKDGMKLVSRAAESKGLSPDPETGRFARMMGKTYQTALERLSLGDRTQIVSFEAAADTRLSDTLEVTFNIR